MRTKRLVAGTGAVGLVLLLAACTSAHSGPGRSSAAPTTDPTTAAILPTTPIPSPTTVAAPQVASIARLTGVPADGRVARSGRTYVVAGAHQVVAVRPGKGVVWSAAQAKGAEQFTVRVAGSTTVITDQFSPDATPSLEHVQSRDTATGRILWTSRTGYFVSTLGTTVYISTCTARVRQGLGDCTIRARDIRSGATRWSTKAYWAAEVEADPSAGPNPLTAPPTPDVLLVDASPDGHRATSAYAYAPATGAYLGRRPGASVQVEGYTVTTGAFDERPSDGCTQSVAAYRSASGARQWQHTFPVPAEGDDPTPTDCDGAYPNRVDNRYVGIRTTGLRPALIDVRTGRTLWRAAQSGMIVARVGKRVVLGPDTLGGGPGVRVADLATGRTVWTASADGSDGVAVVGSRVIVSPRSCDGVASADDSPVDSVVFDAARGTVRNLARGCLVGSGTDWYATQQGLTIFVHAAS